MSEFESHQSYRRFARSVRRDMRYVRTPEHEAFLVEVLRTSEPRMGKIKEGAIFWRAQLGHDWRTESQDGKTFEIPWPHSRDRMMPRLQQAVEGRANASGIPVLYLSTQKETAMSEVRPWVGTSISLAQFQTSRELTLIDCYRHHSEKWIFFEEEPSPDERQRAVWADIDGAFAEPIDRSDDVTRYVPTQIISELFKSKGLDGIVYKSSFGEKGYNIALFDLDAAKLINCSLCDAKTLEFSFSEPIDRYYVKDDT